MTIQHTVVFSLTHSAGTPQETAFLADGRAALTSIPGVSDFVISRQVSAKSDFDFQFSMQFNDQDDYDAYNVHPAHVAFVESRWVTEVTAFQEYDFVTL